MLTGLIGFVIGAVSGGFGGLIGTLVLVGILLDKTEGHRKD